MTRRGLQVGFGDPIPPQDWALLEGRLDVVRLDMQVRQDTTPAVQALAHGLTPLCIIREPAQILRLPDGAEAEILNEPDLFGPVPPTQYTDLVLRCIEVGATRPGIRLWAGSVSNLQTRGYRYLRNLPWYRFPLSVGCSFHRYPHGDRGFHVSANKTWLFGRKWTRAEEIAELRRIVGQRPLAHTEVGYNGIDYTEEQQVQNMLLERQFAETQGIDLIVAYQIGSGPTGTGQYENEYGLSEYDRDSQGRRVWKPVAYAWFKEGSPPPPTPPGAPMETTEDDRKDLIGKLEDFYRTVLARPPRDTSVDALGYGLWPQVYHEARGLGATHDQALDLMFARIFEAAGIDPGQPTEPTTPTPPPTGHPTHMQPLHGYLRIGPHESFADDTGPRRVAVCSWFPGIRIWRDDPDEARRQMDRMVGRWQGARVFAHLKESRFWSGLEVLPEWNNYDHLLRTFLEEMWARQLRVSLTFGDLQYTPSERHPELYQRVAGICRSVNEQVVCLSGMVNEARVNSIEKEDWSYWAHLSRLWQEIYPWGQHGLSDPGDQEEPGPLQASCRAPATVALLHGTRIPPMDAIRRAFNVRYEGDIGKPIVQDEPTGPGDDVYQPVDDPAWLFGLYTIHVITGQMVTYFSGASLRNRKPLDSDWGFTELPRLWQQLALPEDVGTYHLTPGHRSDAAVGARTFSDQGEGPHRVDQAVGADRAYAIAYGGRGAWRLYSRWHAHYRVFVHSGVIAEGDVSPGENLSALDAGVKAAVIELVRP
jgi:hypothetical protein